jgi:signal transduction histidine kinase
MSAAERSIKTEKKRQSNRAAERAGQVLPFANHSSHSVQFYKDESLFISDLSRFIGGAIMAGDTAIVIATRPHRDSLSQRLQAIGLDLDRVSGRGCYIALDAAETLSKFMRNGWPDEKLFNQTMATVLGQGLATSTGKMRHVTAFGEMVTLLCADKNNDAAVRLEQLWNNLAETYSFSLRCAYPIAEFNREAQGETLLRICGEHSEVIPPQRQGSVNVKNDRDNENENEKAENRIRSITELQQKALALENEISERKQVEETLRRTKADLEATVEQRTSTLRQLSARLLTLQDIERRRIARELHDSFGQYLVGLKLNVDMLRQAPKREELWNETEELMQRCIGEVRTLSYLLHPPTMDEAGFVSAARWYVEGFGERSGVRVTLDAPEELDRLPDPIELTLFRVLQEALTNVHRHSGASRAYVAISQDEAHVLMEVRDNGRGMPSDLLRQFDATGAGMGVGLAGVRERARELCGKLTIESDRNGTLLAIEIPHFATKEKGHKDN